MCRRRLGTCCSSSALTVTPCVPGPATTRADARGAPVSRPREHRAPPHARPPRPRDARRRVRRVPAVHRRGTADHHGVGGRRRGRGQAAQGAHRAAAPQGGGGGGARGLVAARAAVRRGFIMPWADVTALIASRRAEEGASSAGGCTPRTAGPVLGDAARRVAVDGISFAELVADAPTLSPRERRMIVSALLGRASFRCVMCAPPHHNQSQTRKYQATNQIKSNQLTRQRRVLFGSHNLLGADP